MHASAGVLQAQADVVSLFRHKGKDALDILILAKAHHAVELVALNLLKLLSHSCQTVGVVCCVADNLRIGRKNLPATSEACYCITLSQTLNKGATADRERCILVQEVGYSADGSDILTLVLT